MSSKKQTIKPLPVEKNAKKSVSGKDKKLWMRIAVLILAGIMILGAILLPLL
ncbi:hypothetical protein [Ruminococcus sp.]|uniref:hypothetical protein n=1 Tax=Ruminococcus sp. TaxID=41978 RepID=UPI0025D536A7|nr:hypothetical protein [Ruminococcus sp.]MBQ6252177.1 hypothetical protein [Ruminococcus sp.]MBR3666664.1 hypothetical protein [Ruminococcus sp.]MBR6995449.1 hypothetical protein [Ruminococcus sp.]